MNQYLAECPKCPNKAKDKTKVKELFGWRTMADGNVIPQSNCKKCRVRIQRLRKLKGLQVSRT
jgi:hypothetical protein